MSINRIFNITFVIAGALAGRSMATRESGVFSLTDLAIGGLVGVGIVSVAVSIWKKVSK